MDEILRMLDALQGSLDEMHACAQREQFKGVAEECRRALSLLSRLDLVAQFADAQKQNRTEGK
jgi:hypothetical protein